MNKRLKDVLDEQPFDNVLWEKIFAKMSLLLTYMEKSKGNYDIDDPEIRWVNDRVEYWNKGGRLLTKQEMQIANTYWNKYK